MPAAIVGPGNHFRVAVRLDGEHSVATYKTSEPLSFAQIMLALAELHGQRPASILVRVK